MTRKKKTIFEVTARPNVSGNRRFLKEFKTKGQAKSFVKKLTTPGKVKRVNINGKKVTIRQTSFRAAQSGLGIKNPRIRKLKRFR